MNSLPFCVVGFQGNERGEWLSNLRFAVFALGNRQYEHFNKVGKEVDQLLAEQGEQKHIH
jgi:NADPH-ferrihemoprotein reductase